MEQVQETLSWLDQATVDFVAKRNVQQSPYQQSSEWLASAKATLTSWRQAAAADHAGAMARSKTFPNPKPRLRLMPRL